MQDSELSNKHHDQSPIDLQQVLQSAGSRRQTAAVALVMQMKRNGFIKLINYGISLQTITELFAKSQSFFALDMDQKMLAAHPTSASPHRGYSFIGQENISSISGFADEFIGCRNLIDMKETFDFGSPLDQEHSNRWPQPEVATGFREIMEGSFDELHQLLVKILRLFAEGMGLHESYFEAYHNKRHHEMRLLYYPEITAGELSGETTRIADHTDFGSASFLLQDQSGGLEIRASHSQEYRAVNSEPGELIMILGDCFQRWTGDYLWAVPHRVTIPQQLDVHEESTVKARFSIAFFGKPNKDVNVGNLPDDRFKTRSYAPISAGAYNNSKLYKTY